jgi:aromatic ring hydroxylase
MNQSRAGETTGIGQVGARHGAGSPIKEEIGLRYSYNLEEKKEVVKRLVGIAET